jgi:hypothetical protein
MSEPSLTQKVKQALAKNKNYKARRIIDFIEGVCDGIDECLDCGMRRNDASMAAKKNKFKKYIKKLHTAEKSLSDLRDFIEYERKQPGSIVKAYSFQHRSNKNFNLYEAIFAIDEYIAGLKIFLESYKSKSGPKDHIGYALALLVAKNYYWAFGTYPATAKGQKKFKKSDLVEFDASPYDRLCDALAEHLKIHKAFKLDIEISWKSKRKAIEYVKGDKFMAS